ncbi:MAG: hypothetical protein CMJ84_07870 [Planctomycetes bacterium]|jgi:YVTN family beta-propeller protein|nr:hypothetical protein [Planctomycetota bacterium]MDP6410262.1 hypothetical protein [Planctomycetota bacterium]
MHPLILSLGALVPLWSPAVSTAPAAQNPVDVPFDDQAGRWMNFELPPQDPICFSHDGGWVWVANQVGRQLQRFRIGHAGPEYSLPLSPGVVAVVARPESEELWLVDHLTSSVGVMEGATGTLERTIRVGNAPQGLVFSGDGTRAWVTCSSDNRVDVIDTATYEVVHSIPVPGREPRGIARVGSDLFVASFLSGNGTAPMGNPETSDPDDARSVEVVGEHDQVTPLPDRDLFTIRLGATAADDALDPGATIRGVGTLLYDVVQRPGTDELWIPHTEALNAGHRGEVSFIEGQVVRNRIAVVRPQLAGGALGGVGVSFIDLDVLAPNPDVRCAEPTDVAFSRTGDRAFVCGYGSNSVAVLDVGPDGATWAGSIRIQATTLYPDGAGPRNCVVSPDGHWLYVFNKGENSLSRVPLDLLPAQPNFRYEAPIARALGWDPTPVDIVQGRIHFIRTANSLSRTSSCNSCHVDGHLDGLAWNLGLFMDPEITPPEEMAFPLDDKGPMVTQSVRRLKEIGPYHWRGERKELADFDVAFPGLLERPGEDGPEGIRQNFPYIAQYMETLAIPPNPHQSRNRRYVGTENLGANVFMNRVLSNGVACATCHVLPLGTAGEIVEHGGGGLAPATAVPSLRGVSAKGAAAFDVGGDFGTRTELGAGWGHGGVWPDLEAALAHGAGDLRSLGLTPDERIQLGHFLKVFDTGLAPSTVFQGTAHAANAAPFAAVELAYLLGEAEAGHCDATFSYGPVPWGNGERHMMGVYRPGTGSFQQASISLDRILPAELIALAAGGQPVTFYGLPRLMGRPTAIDRDLDLLLDLDESAWGTAEGNNDCDGDKLPDGYEVLWGTDPLVIDANLCLDQTPPELLGPVRIIYTTTNAVKFEYETDEPTRVLISYDDGPPVMREPLKPKQGVAFSTVISELEPDRHYVFHLDMEDPKGNQRVVDFDVKTRPLAFGAPVRIEKIDMFVLRSAAARMLMRARVQLARGEGLPEEGYVLEAVLYHDIGGQLKLVSSELLSSPSGADGSARLQLVLPPGLAVAPGTLELVVREVRVPPGAAPHVRGADEVFTAAAPL